MRLPEPKPRDHGENVIPLINIVFLLLIFFMLAGTLSPPDPFDIEPPQTREGRTMDEPGRGLLLLSSDGSLAFEGDTLSLEELPVRVGERIEEEDGFLEITLKADAGTSATQLLDVMDALRDAGAESLKLLTTPEA